MFGTMQDYPLTIGMLFRHGMAVHGDSEVVTFEGDGSRRASFREVGDRIERLAAALQRLGIQPGDRVGTFAWNIQEHLEAYFAVPGIGAVLHTLNIRLFPEQLEYVVNHAADRIVLVDGSLIPLLIKVAPQLTSVEKYVVIGDGDTATLAEAAPDVEILEYDALLAAEAPGIEWPEVDERAAAAMCYTSGTTGNPKGVVYTHRSTFLHSFAAAYLLGIGERDRILPIVPMFHANAWGLPYAGWTFGSRLPAPEPVPPGRAAGPLHQRGEADVLRRGPDDLVGRAALLRRQPRRARPHVVADDHLRRLGRAARVDGGVRDEARRAHDPGLGHDRDEPAGRGRPPAEGRRARHDRGAGVAVAHRSRRAGCRAAHRRRRRHTDGERRQRGRRDRGAGPVDHRLVLRRPDTREVRRRLAADRRRRHRSTSGATSRSPTGRRTSSSPVASGSLPSSSRTT